MIPGEIITKTDEIIINKDSDALKIKVSNTGDRPIQVGSHYHFYETNEFLSFERDKTKEWDLILQREPQFDLNLAKQER